MRTFFMLVGLSACDHALWWSFLVCDRGLRPMLLVVMVFSVASLLCKGEKVANRIFHGE